MPVIFYKLDENKNVVQATREELAAMKDEDRLLAHDEVAGVLISTVFIPFNLMPHKPNSAPVCFETMVFESEGDANVVARYATYAAALAGHKAAIEAWKTGRLH